MKHKYVASCFFLLLIIQPIGVLCQGNSMAPEHYLCFRAHTSPVIDGNIDEEPWQEASWSGYFVDIEGRDKEKPYLGTRMKMLWDDKHLFIAAELEEPHIWATLTERESIIYRDNDFEVFIDPDGNGINYYELEVNAFGTELDLFMDKPYHLAGKADLDWDFEGLRTAVKINGTVNDPDDQDSSWTVEMAIPWGAVIQHLPGSQKPGQGDSWRMNFSRVQWETLIEEGKYKKRKDPESGEPLPENNWVWSAQGVINMHQPETWGYVQFCDQGATAKSERNLRPETPRYWVWMGGRAGTCNAAWDSIFQKLQEAGITGVLIGADTALLRRVIPLAEAHQVEVHAWFWTMNRQEADTTWLSVNRNGKSLAEEEAYVGYYKFMCPALPEVRTYLAHKIDALSAVEGLKGIHMDYVRYVDAILPVGLQPKYNLVQDHVMAAFDYGYHPYMRALFREGYGTDPFEITEVSDEEAWLQFRLDQLNATVRRLRNQVRCNGADISAAVFPTPAMSKEMVRQEWDKWQLDYYFPMVYHNFYNEPVSWIADVMIENKKSLPPESRVFCGLYVPALKQDRELSLAMEAAIAGGADGIAFFDYGALDEALLSQIRVFISNH